MAFVPDQAQKTRSGSSAADPVDRGETVTGLVSVIMPACNCAHLLAESVCSVIGQSYGDWELILVDDASSDATVAVAEEFAKYDSRVRVNRLTKNGGVAKARNAGMRAAKGQYLAFLDSDDLWLPQKLALQTEFLRQSGAGFCFGGYRRFRANGDPGELIGVPTRVDYEGLLRGNVIGCLTVMIDRVKVGPFEMPSIRHEDYATWLGILKQGHVAYGIQQDLARYRVSLTSLTGNKLRSAAWTWRIYRQREGLSLAKAAWCFVCYTGRSFATRYLPRTGRNAP